MILSDQEVDANTPWGNGTFQGRLVEPSKWTGYTALQIGNVKDWVAQIHANPASVLGADLSLVQNLVEGGTKAIVDGKQVSAFNAALMQFGQLQLNNVSSATQQVMGLAVQSAGMLSSNFRQMAKLFDRDASQYLRISAALDIAGQVLSSVLEFLGSIPVVGWILDIVLGFATLILDMAEASREESIEAAYATIARNLSVPISATEFDTELDEQFARTVMKALSWYDDYNPQALFLPQYLGAGDSWKAHQVWNDHLGTQDGHRLGAGWVVRGPNMVGGLGMVPGTGNLTSAWFFGSQLNKLGRGVKTPAGGFRDLGSLYPTATGIGNTQWSLIMSPGPLMYSLEPRALMGAWQEYALDALVFAQNILSGWTAMPTAVGEYSNQFYCVDETVGIGNCDKANGKKRTIPSDWADGPHVSVCGYIYRMFFERTLSQRMQLPTLPNAQTYATSIGTFLDPESVDVGAENMVTNRALENLYQRQHDTLKSIYCMYVDGYDQERFPAFRDGALRDQWEESATALLASEDWRRVTFIDMPEGDLKNAVYQKAVDAGIANPEMMNLPCPPNLTMCPPDTVTTGDPTVLGDPDPPPPPEPNNVPQFELEASVGGKKKGAGGGAAIALGAAAAALMLLRR